MKIRWKIVQNRAWRRVGPSWGLLECLLGVLGRLGSILGASWERLGASWGRPGGIPEPEGDPTWTPGWAQNRPKIDPKSHWFFDRFLDAILTKNGYRMDPQTFQKRSKKVFHFSIVFDIDFWTDLGSRNPWKWAPRVHEKLIFIKSPFPILTYFWKQKWWKKAPKMEPKWLKKSIKKSEVFLIDFGPMFEGFWEHFGSQNTIKSRVVN